MGFRGCQYKNDIGRRLFQGLQQSIKGSDGEHVHLVYDINFVFSFCRAVCYLFPDFTDIIYTVIGCRINFDNIHGTSCRNCFTACTFSTRASIYGMFAVDCLGKYFCDGCLTGSSRSTEQICMADTVCLYLVL